MKISEVPNNSYFFAVDLYNVPSVYYKEGDGKIHKLRKNLGRDFSKEDDYEFEVRFVCIPGTFFRGG